MKLTTEMYNAILERGGILLTSHNFVVARVDGVEYFGTQSPQYPCSVPVASSVIIIDFWAPSYTAEELLMMIQAPRVLYASNYNSVDTHRYRSFAEAYKDLNTTATTETAYPKQCTCNIVELMKGGCGCGGV